MYIRTLDGAFMARFIMTKLTRNTGLQIIALMAAVIGFSSSALAEVGGNADPARLQAATDHSSVLVFGKFQLLKNGREIKFSDGFLGNSASIRLYQADTGREFSVRTGEDGEFSRELEPGDYYVMSIAFLHQGQLIRPETNFMFNVAGDNEASYVGTITLEAKFSSGYYGMQGEFERFTITNECANKCEIRLAELGLADASLATSLPSWQEFVAYR